eukprot:3426937-Pyramimonas_sp.AAC.1
MEYALPPCDWLPHQEYALFPPVIGSAAVDFPRSGGPGTQDVVRCPYRLPRVGAWRVGVAHVTRQQFGGLRGARLLADVILRPTECTNQRQASRVYSHDRPIRSTLWGVECILAVIGRGGPVK